MRSRLKTITAALVAIYLCLCLAACALERTLLYHPGPEPTHDPGGLGLDWHDVRLATEDGESLGAWLVEVPEPNGCILLSHGNAGSLENRIGLTATFAEMGFSTLVYDYRGFGTSTGSPTENGLYADGVAAYQWLLEQGWKPSSIILWGESLGGGVATELATRFECAALVLDHSFTSAADTGAHHYPWLPVQLLSRERFDSLKKIPDISVPILIIHSPADRVIPYEQAERLYAAAPQGTRLLTTEGGHNGLGFMSRPGYRTQVHTFLRESTEEQ